MSADPASPQPAWTAYVTLRILVAPLCALVFILAGLFAPTRRARFPLLGAGIIEGAVFGVVASTWFYQAIRA
jgi:hypothetical protein